MPIFEFACQDGHEFQLWNDAARLCPTCGSEFLKRVFITPPMVNTPKTKVLDNMIRGELERQGITNIQGGGHEGDREKVTRKSTPEDLKADKIMADFPQMKDPTEIQKAQQWAKTKWGGLDPKSVINSRLPANETLRQMIPTGTSFRDGKHMAVPPSSPNLFHANDSRFVQRTKRLHPEDLKKAG